MMKRIVTSIAVSLLTLLGAQAQMPLPVLTPLKDMKADLHPAKKNGKWGYANQKNKFVINPVFDAAEGFIRVGYKDGTVLDVAKVKVGSRWGYISRENVYFIEPAFEFITDFDIHSVAFARNGSQYTMYGVDPSYSINLGARVLKATVLETGFSAVPQFSFRGYAVAMKNGRYGILDASGKWLVPANCDSIVKDPDMGLYKLECRGLTGYATYEGKIVFPPEFKSIEAFAPGILIADNGRKGLFDTEGKAIIPADYDVIEPFNDNLLLVRDGKSGLATMKGKMIIPVEYDAIEQMSDGNFMVKGADGYNVYGPDCTPLFPTGFDSLELDERLGYIVMKDGMYGRLDEHGKYMYPCRFPSVPDPQQKGYVEMMVEGVPYIFFAGDSEPKSVSEYDDALYRSMSDRSYVASTALPAWLKGHMGRGKIENKVLLEDESPSWISFKYDEPSAYNGYTLICGKKLGAIVPITYFEEDEVMVYDRGDLVFFLVPEPDFFATMYVYDTASAKLSEIPLGDENKVFALSHGICAETLENNKSKPNPIERFYNLNPGMASAPALCYTFHEWAGVVDVAVCLNGGNTYTKLSPGVKSSLTPSNFVLEYDAGSGCVRYGAYFSYSSSGSYNTYEILVHEPAPNGIALYEIITTRNYWRVSRNVARVYRSDAPRTEAYGYVGMGREFFVQPLFLEAKGFDGEEAQVRIGGQWQSLKPEEIAAYDPFILPL